MNTSKVTGDPIRTFELGSRERILDVSAELFSTLGYAGTGLRQIADQVGIKPASLYHHFESKERILEEILRIGLEQTAQSTREAVDALAPSANPRDKVEAAIAGHLRALHQNITYTSTNVRFHGQMPTEVDKRIQPLRTQYTMYWRDLLASAKRLGFLQRGLEISLLRPIIIGTLNRTIAWFDPAQGPVDELVKTCVIALSGMWTKDRTLKPSVGAIRPKRRTAAGARKTAR